MKEKQAEKIIKYVSEVVPLYEVEPERIISELQDPKDEVEEAIQKVYSATEGQAFCTQCSNMKLKDEKAEEYYCPVCI